MEKAVSMRQASCLGAGSRHLCDCICLGLQLASDIGGAQYLLLPCHWAAASPEAWVCNHMPRSWKWMLWLAEASPKARACDHCHPPLEVAALHHG